MVLYVLHKFLGGGGGLCGESAKFYPLLLGNCAKCFTSQSKCANFLPIELISVHFLKKLRVRHGGKLVKCFHTIVIEYFFFSVKGQLHLDPLKNRLKQFCELFRGFLRRYSRIVNDFAVTLTPGK